LKTTRVHVVKTLEPYDHESYKPTDRTTGNMHYMHAHFIWIGRKRLGSLIGDDTWEALNRNN